jgi:methionyl-tRNA formyltransferase
LKRLVLAGNRLGALEALLTFEQIRLVEIFAVEGSRLACCGPMVPCPITPFTKKDKPRMLQQVIDTEFDIFLSNGLPLIMPVSSLRKSHQIFLNVHPSFLPELRGPHPVNGVLFNSHKRAGATLHFMDDGIDEGDIVHQEDFPVTADLDLGLLYRLLFATEKSVTAAGFRKLIASDFNYAGVPQTGGGSYYKRSANDMSVSFETMESREILRRVRSFGIASQGTQAILAGDQYRLFGADQVHNSALVSFFAAKPPGTLLLEYDGKLLVKACDGIVRITSFERINR